MEATNDTKPEEDKTALFAALRASMQAATAQYDTMNDEERKKALSEEMETPKSSIEEQITRANQLEQKHTRAVHDATKIDFGISAEYQNMMDAGNCAIGLFYCNECKTHVTQMSKCKSNGRYHLNESL